MSEKARQIGPYSRPNTLAKLDGRTKEARLTRELRAGLIEHVGGSPSVVQAALIERAVTLALHVALFDRRATEAGGLSERDSKAYLAFSNSLSRCLRHLGMDGAGKKTAKAYTALDYIRDKGAAAASPP